jgi:putative ABC transport system substrate-binding protein
MKAVALLLLLAVTPVSAQTTTERVHRLGELASTRESLDITREEALPELARLGFREGRNLVLDERAADSGAMDGTMREILLGRPDVVIAIGADAIGAAARATKTVPIVTFGADPVQMGHAASFARPGGNVTGLVILAEELDNKRLDLLSQAVPGASRIAALLQPSLSYGRHIERSLRAVAAKRGIELLVLEADGRDDYAAAFAAMRSAKAQALVVTGSPVFNRDAGLLARLATEMQLPVMCEWAENAQSGCLLGYGPNRSEMRRRMAHYIARILKGVTPAELPIETPTHFELAVNRKTAKALGIDMPASLLARVDQVIE